MTDNTAQLRSTSYVLPVQDTAFLLRDEMRDIRFALEYAKAELLLRDWGIRSTIIVFGSAQTPSPEQAQAAMVAAQTDAERTRAERLTLQAGFYDAARPLTPLSPRSRIDGRCHRKTGLRRPCWPRRGGGDRGASGRSA